MMIEEEKIQDVNIMDIKELSFRSKNTLINGNITKLSQLLKKTYKEVRGIRGMGKKSIYEIEDFLEKNDLSFEYVLTIKNISKYKNMWERFWEEFDTVYDLLTVQKKNLGERFKMQLLRRKDIIEKELSE